MFEFLRRRRGKEYKQIIIIRTDLGMNKGKIAAQASHASVSAYLLTKNKYSDIANKWVDNGQKKIVLRVSGEKDLISQFQKAVESGIPAIIISDAGKTQIPSGSKTAVGIGPWNEEELDRLFGDLKLL